MMKKALFLVVVSLLLSHVGISLAQEAEKKAETPAAEKPKAAAAKSETISGSLQAVDADKKLVIVTAAGGIPYSFKVTGATKITVGGSKAKLADLSSVTGKAASVKFRPEKRAGNIAQTIEVQ